MGVRKNARGLKTALIWYGKLINKKKRLDKIWRI